MACEITRHADGYAILASVQPQAMAPERRSPPRSPVGGWQRRDQFPPTKPNACSNSKRACDTLLISRAVIPCKRSGVGTASGEPRLLGFQKRTGLLHRLVYGQDFLSWSSIARSSRRRSSSSVLSSLPWPLNWPACGSGSAAALATPRNLPPAMVRG
jgi:hypothetical protein